jgi:hypothetical protein
LKLAQANSPRDPILKNPSQQKRAGGVAEGVGPEFRSQYHIHKHTKNLKQQYQAQKLNIFESASVTFFCSWI